MKSFILFCRAIIDVGGSQLYARNKAIYYKSKGWDVKIFSFRSGAIYIQGLEEYESCIFPEIGFPSFLYSKKEKERILKSILSFIYKSEEYVIESDSILLSSWAEELAQKVHGKHFLYLLDEQPHTFGLNRDFLDFKYDRSEVAGITDKVIQFVFPDKYLNKTDNDGLVIQAFCINSIDDIEGSNLHIKLNSEVKIGVLGRLNKPYVKPITHKLVEYIKKNKNLNFSVVYIGGSPNQNEINYLEYIYNKLPNAEMHVTGFICPVPRTFLEKFDFFISTSGSANALYKAGFLTISVDGYNFNPNGIMGITTDKTLDPEDNQPQLEKILNDLIVEKLYKKEQLTRNDYYDPNYYFEPHIKFVENSKNLSNVYYNFNNIHLPLRFWILKVLLLFINPIWLHKIVDRFVTVR